MKRVATAAAVALLVAAPAAAADVTRILQPQGRCATTSYTATTPQSVLARLDGSGDWDLTSSTGDSAHGAGGREAVQAIGTGRLRFTACRRGGASRRATLRLSTFPVVLGPAPTTSQVLVRTQDTTGLRALGLDLGEDGGKGDVTVILHGPEDLQALKSLDLPFRTTIADLDAHDRRARAAEARRAPSGLPSGRTTYRRYGEIQEELKKLQAAHPGTSRMTKLALPSSQGREITGIELADDPARAATDGRPTFVLVGVHHAREWPAAEVATEFVHDLLQDPGDLLGKVRILVFPVQNPDGYESSRGLAQLDPAPDSGVTDTVYGGLAGDHGPYRRKTCSGPLPAAAPCDLQPGADSNRNYGPLWGGTGSSTLPFEQDYQGSTPYSEPETEGMRRLLATTNATMVLSLHNVAAGVLRPPGVAADGPPADEAAMKALGDRLAKITGYTSASFHDGLGYDGSGILEDYGYTGLGIFTYTIELGGTSFHGDYDEHVVQQWNGPSGQGGMRLALRTIAAAAADATNHATLAGAAPAGAAPAGAVLTVKKTFTALTRKPCVASGGILVRNNAPPVACVESGAPATEVPESVELTMTVPANGRYAWNLPPSRAKEYTLTCARGGTTYQTVPLSIGRGETKTLDLACGVPPKKAVKKKAVKKKKAKAKRRPR